MRKKDVVLMATVTSFETLAHPSKSELRQFAELFLPLFSASTDEARRQAIAALSQHPDIPPPVAFFIASQPISLSAPFLISSKALDDETLITIARTQGRAHARAIVRREALSPTVIDALVGIGHAQSASMPATSAKAADVPVTRQEPAPAVEPVSIPAEITEVPVNRQLREEELRQQIKTMARQVSRPADDVLGLRRLSDIQEALLVRFARERDARQFSAALANSLSASHWLAERVMLDISGVQLATTLKGLGMGMQDATFVLQGFYPHLGRKTGDLSRAEAILHTLDAVACEQRIESWRRADSYTFQPKDSDQQRRFG
ncbi:DUF2336 domain-containing protein [Agrobacterium sp.]|uniref:DUF2336 domain-containing protein n=1 Tax=Agrobacterium sp. TaxID=361 RepID=UPI0028AA1F3C|nr:DUF2336 domain-containing protein [Agrobacterium sp.]